MDDYRQRESLSFEKVAKKKQRSKYQKWSLDNPLLVGGYIAVIAFFVVLVIGINIGSDGGVIGREDIGTIATHDYKASRDFTFDRVDQEATARVREQRVAEVLPIFQWDKRYHEETLNRLHGAFDLMQQGIEQELALLESRRVIRESAGNLAQVDSARQAWADALLAHHLGDDIFEDYVSTRELTSEEIAAAIDAWCAANHDSFVQILGYSISDSLYSWLVSERFSSELEDGLLQVFDVVLGRMIVSTRQEVDSIEDLNVSWFESGEKHQKKVSSSEKSTISSLSAAESLARTLLKEKFLQVPESFNQYFIQFIRPNLKYDESATQRERQNVSDKTAELRIIEEYKKGQTIVGRGNPIKLVHFELFEKMAQHQSDTENRSLYWIALSVVIAMLSYLMWHSMRSTTGRRKKNRDALYFATSLLALAVILKLFMFLSHALDSLYHLPYSVMLLFPFASMPMVMRIVVNRQYAYLYAVCTLVLSGLIIEDGSIMLPYVMVSTMAGCLLMERPKRSNSVLRYSLLIGAISALMAVSIYLLRGSNLAQADYVMIVILGFSSGPISAGVVMIGLPLSESLFGYVTSNKLLELSNLEHPALKTLFLEAPGTYQHSIMVGQLNEAAADAIGANAILARVGGYYHDIGKVKNAQYFAENQRGDNPHNRLKPNMSALILKAHERDGMDIARKYKLPQDIIDFIATHHGTSRIEYFYQRAKEQQERVLEDDYRYPGPRPQTRETGICMVSDMVEAAVRSLPDKSPDRILVLVHKLINHKFTDGQFNECDLTLRDLNDIANAQISVLNAFYHHRPEYPDQKKEREKLDAEKREKVEAEKREKAEAEKREKAESEKKSVECVLDSKPEEKAVDNDKSEQDSKTADKASDKGDGDKASKSEKSGKSSKEKSEKNADKSKKASDKSEVLEIVAEDTGKPEKVADDVEDPSLHAFEALTTSSPKGRDLAESSNSSAQDKKVSKSNGEGDSGDFEHENSSSVREEGDDDEASQEAGELAEEKRLKSERDEADALLKEDEDSASDEGEKQSEPSHLSVHETYELSFSSQVNVFKKS